VVLRGGQGQNGFSIREGQERRLFSGKKFFHDHPISGASKCSLDHDLVQGGLRLCHFMAEDYSFPSG